MPRVSEAHRAARRSQILDAAARCFAREGFHRATMHDVVRESGLSPGAIYRYFRSKDDLVQTIAAERHARERAWLADANRGADVLAQVRGLARAFFGALRDPAERTRRSQTIQLWAEALRRPDIRRLVRRGVDEPRAALRALVERAQRQGALPRDLAPDAVARMMIALFQGFVLQQAWDRRVDGDAYLATLERVIDALAREVSRPRPPRTASARRE
jgi:AcrR family transcriptional regulator